MIPPPDDTRLTNYLDMPERGLCKYIVRVGERIDETICCGHDQFSDSAYCEHHYRLCYQPAGKMPSIPKEAA